MRHLCLQETLKNFEIVVLFLMHGSGTGGLLLFKSSKKRKIQKALHSANWHQQLL